MCVIAALQYSCEASILLHLIQFNLLQHFWMLFSVNSPLSTPLSVFGYLVASVVGNYCLLLTMGGQHYTLKPMIRDLQWIRHYGLIIAS